ncbi:MAG: cytochrome P450 [Desulfobulbia bacterium]
MKLPRYSVSPDNPDFFNNPYPYYGQMRSLGSAVYWEDYDKIAFCDFAPVNTILRDRRFGREITHLISREQAGLEPIPDHLATLYEFESRSMLEREPPAHTRLRGLVNKAFVSRNIQKMRGRIETLSHALIDEFEGRHETDLLPAYAEKIPIIVICEILGVPVSVSDQLLEWSHKMVAMYQFNRDRLIEDNAIAAMNSFSAFIRDYADERRKSPGDDLISLLIEATEDGDRLTNDELITTCILLLNAGHEATVHGMGNAIKALIENEVNVAEVFADDQSANAAADELLRYNPPLHLFSRYVLEDLEFDGIKLSRGQSVALLLGAANHDPKRYKTPDKLDFNRGGAGHLAFGAGIHFCLGAPLARLEMAVALKVLFDRLPGLKISERPGYRDQYHFHGLKRLLVNWQEEEIGSG